MPSEQPQANAIEDEPRSPRRIALAFVEATPGLVFLLEDFRAAFAAYAGLSHAGLPEFETLRIDRDADLSGFDAIVLALSAHGGQSVAASLSLPRARSGTRLYTIMETDGLNPDDARPLAQELQNNALEHGLLWCGGTIMATEGKAESLCTSPRMGLLRRPFSEAMDKLVGAARMGCSIKRAQELGGADVSAFDRDGIVAAKPAIPALFWRQATKRGV